MTTITRTTAAPVVPSTGALRPLGIDEVHITGGFWGERQDVNGGATLAHIEHWLEKEGWLGNFDLAASGALPEGRRGREFSDSEIYKYLEALAWEIGRRGGDDALEERFRSVVGRVAAAQDADGYLNTQFGRAGQAERWSDLEWGHELYCLGHLFQAAVARGRTRPDADDGLVDIARRAADLIYGVFGPTGRPAVCGHPEVEVGLTELARLTGEPRYLELATLFVERRGHGVLKDVEWGRSYFQDDVPVRDAQVLRGHAVRANYLAAGAVDVAVDSGDDGLLGALHRQWSTTVARRTYLTGGQGSHHQDEAFGDDWELPSDRAYSETCAGIASIMFSWRLLLAENDVRYADLIERTLYNVVATSPSAAGTSFFYANTLHQRDPGVEVSLDEVSPRASSSMRSAWFEVSCCPPNVARTFASLASLIATVDDDGLQLHQFAPARIDTALADGRRVVLDVQTDYPRSGVVTVRVVEALAEPTTLSIRIPEWAGDADVRVVRQGAVLEQLPTGPGYASVRRTFKAGDTIEVTLPMRPRFTRPDPRIDAVRGSVAVERGPQVFCAESTDLPAGVADLAAITVDPSRSPLDDGQNVVVSGVVHERDDTGWAYSESPRAADEPRPIEVVLRPYNSWAERGPSTMRVWMPTM